jgi:hypothetical protein
MVLSRLFRVLVVGGGALVAAGCGGDSAVRPTSGNQVLPDGGIMSPSSPMPTGGGTMGGGGGSTGGGGTGAPMGW